MSYFTYQAISGGAFSPAKLGVSSRTVSAYTSFFEITSISANITANIDLISAGIFAPFTPLNTSPVIGILYNDPISSLGLHLSALSAVPSTVFSAYGGNLFSMNNIFSNQTAALLLKDGSTVEFTALTSGSTRVLAAASSIAYDDSWPERQRLAELGYV